MATLALAPALDLAHDPAGSILRADTALRTSGGRSVWLRMPAPAVPNDPAEQLGLATPQFQDLPLGPVVFRKKNSTRTLLVAASAVAHITQTLAFGSAQVLFATAVGIVIDDALYSIDDCVAAQAFGTPYSYTLTLRAPVR